MCQMCKQAIIIPGKPVAALHVPHPVAAQGEAAPPVRSDIQHNFVGEETPKKVAEDSSLGLGGVILAVALIGLVFLCGGPGGFFVLLLCVGFIGLIIWFGGVALYYLMSEISSNNRRNRRR